MPFLSEQTLVGLADKWELLVAGILGSAIAGIPIGKLVYDVYDAIWWHMRGGYSCSNRPCNLVAQKVLLEVVAKHGKNTQEKVTKTFHKRLDLIYDWGLYDKDNELQIGFVRRHWALIHSAGAVITSICLSAIISLGVVFYLFVFYPSLLYPSLFERTVAIFGIWLIGVLLCIILCRSMKRLREIVDIYEKAIIVSEVSTKRMEQMLENLCRYNDRTEAGEAR